jgi:glycosyltransferase involved in cell wall biosynthesis
LVAKRDVRDVGDLPRRRAGAALMSESTSSTNQAGLTFAGEQSQSKGAEETRTCPQLTFVVPCYNEEAVLPETASRLKDLVQELIHSGRIRSGSAILFVDDGSRDKTWPLIEELAKARLVFHGIKLSRNHGHQNALLAGLLSAEGDVLVSVDADLQDDLSAIRAMIDAYTAGAEIVYGVRKGRTSDSFLKRFSAETYYRVLAMMGVRLVFNHADFRLLSRRAIEALREYRETNLFLRGLIPQLGFNTSTVYYERKERFAGKSKYPVSKMWSLAVDGITSFSTVPLGMITVLGFVVSLASFGFGAWALWAKLAHLPIVPGWASTVVSIYALGGIQLLAIGVIGQYLAKIYVEVKARPRFTIEKIL